MIELTIEDMSVEGQGIGRTPDGLVVFVEGAVKGDLVRAEVTKAKKRFAFAKAIETLDPSPLRNPEFDCPSYGQGCGGCPLGPLEYEAQLRIKEKQVRDRLERIAGIEFAEEQGSGAACFLPIVGMSDEDNGGQGPWRYRNKATFPVSTGGIITRKGGIVENLGEVAIGFYEGKSHKVVDCGDCYLQSMAAMAAADALRRFMYEDNITGYDPKWEKGLMRNMTVKTGFGTGEVMVILGINGKGIPGAPKLVEMLDEAIEEVGYSLKSVVLDIDKAGGKGAGKNKYEVIAGSPTITDRVGDLKYEISPASFYQVNPAQMKRLYDKVRELVARCAGREAEVGSAGGSGPVILDLYCGIGSIGLYCADLADMVIGIESVEEAVRDANRNSVINGIVNTRYICGRAEEVIPAAVSQAKADSADIAILDPPRAGCRQELLDAIAFADIPDIIYVSCDPATLARDMAILGEHGYRLIEATPYDLFPSTNHCETICLITRERTVGDK